MLKGWLFYLSLLGQFLLVVLGAIVSLSDSWSKSHKLLLISLFVLFGATAFISSIMQFSDSKNENERLYGKLDNVNLGISELKRLTQARPDDPPSKVLAAAAQKIIELDAKTKQLEEGVKDIVSVRRLTNVQKEILFKEIAGYCLKTKTFNVDLVWQNDSEAIFYANDFYELLNKTKCWQGYRSLVGEQFKPAVLPKGISIIIKDKDNVSQEAKLLLSAFKKANIPHEFGVSNSIPSTVMIFVGFKR